MSGNASGKVYMRLRLRLIAVWDMYANGPSYSIISDRL
jgi:hypothetical protein